MAPASPCGENPSADRPFRAYRMELTLALLLVCAFLFAGLGLALPDWRRAAAGVLVGVGLVAVLAGVLDPAERTLVTEHSYAGFEGAALEVSVVDFPTSTFTAPGWQWPLPFFAFAALWATALLLLGKRYPANGYVLPVLLAWSGTAAWLGMQACAAPAAVVQPVGIDRVLWPAGLAMALLVARHAGSLASLFLGLSAATVIARLPAALFSKYASDHQLGTSLDISSIRDIVNPMTQMQFEPRLAPGSGEQQFWLIWLEHVIAYPAFYTLSIAGIAFAAYMFHKHGEPSPAK